MDFGKLTEISHLAYSILFGQLIILLIHYPCTVALITSPDLADWSRADYADHESHDQDNGAKWRALTR